VSSPAFRARETIEIVIKTSRVRSELRYDERIYEASPRRLLEVINEIEDERKTVLLVGHNPGMEQLLELLTGEVQVMPTAALASIAAKTTAWSALSDGEATLEWLIKPKDLDEH
jgi:phosphohistidine phosphatase